MTTNTTISDSEDWAEVVPFENTMIEDLSINDSHPNPNWEILPLLPTIINPEVNQSVIDDKYLSTPTDSPSMTSHQSQKLNPMNEEKDEIFSVHSLENSCHSLLSLDSLQIITNQQSIDSLTSSFSNIEHQSTNDDFMSLSEIPPIHENSELNDNSITSYVNIVEELENQRVIVAELRNRLQTVSHERDQAIEIIEEMKTNHLSNELELRNLRSTNAQILQLNRNLQINKRRKSFKKKKSGRKVQSKKNSLSNKTGYFRPSMPAKSRFRKQRYNHRSIFCKRRSW